MVGANNFFKICFCYPQICLQCSHRQYLESLTLSPTQVLILQKDCVIISDLFLGFVLT